MHLTFGVTCFLISFITDEEVLSTMMALLWIQIVIPIIESVFVVLITAHEHEYIKARLSIFKPEFIEFRG